MSAMSKVVSLTVVSFLIMIGFSSAAMAKEKLAYPPAASARGSELEKYSGRIEKADEAKREAFALASLLSVSYAAANSLTKCSSGNPGFTAFDTYGVPVKNSEGEFLGSIADILMSNRDRENALAVINIGSASDYPERHWYGDSAGLTLVPMTALKFVETKSGKLEFVLDSTEAKLEAAPSFDATKIDDPQYDIQLYRRYGVQPYWAEDCVTHDK